MTHTKAALIVMLLAAAAHASCISDATAIVLSEQGLLIGAVIGFTAVIIALAYMIGTTLGHTHYVVFAKDEAYHLFFSILMLIAFSGILAFSCELISFFYHGTFENLGPLASNCYLGEGSGLNSTASCYLKVVKNDATRLSKSYIQNYLDYLMESTFSFSLAIPLLNAYTAIPGAYRRVVSNQYDIILNTFLIPSLMSLSMQKIGLDFINENVIRWILPTAFVLRFFIPTRMMGNMLIALSLGLYVIVPFMFVFNLAMYDAVLSDCNEFASAVCDNVLDSYSCMDAPQTACSNPDGFWMVARLIPQAIFLPNLTIAILITFLSAVNKGLRVVG
ncbi:hypothetical protein L0Y65_03470 [Candidatus Micrarchaeota archaeon]|nr:hypothetical protein [Candidatus Micrarchaeota archaeon]